MKIFVLGGDGFCGWPVSLRLSARGDDVLIVDNLSRRRIDRELGIASLTPIRPMRERLAAWRAAGGGEIRHAKLDLARDYGALCALLRAERPDAIVHLAEQRSVPYSMASPRARRYTFDNNLGATNNVLIAMVESGVDAHLVHMGSTGIYGYETLGYRVPDGGYVRIDLRAEEGGATREILHPANPLSVYHLTKAQDQLALAFFCKHEGVRVTDLVQGTVWGTQTEETARDERLINRFDYDSVFGTVLNRFVLQAALNHPLTIYGAGAQTRAFIHIRDVMRCIEIALANPPGAGERMKVFNQIAETMRIADIAGLIAAAWPGVAIAGLENPRDEPAENSLSLSNSGLVSLGLAPKMIAEGVLTEIRDVAMRYAARADKSVIAPRPAAAKSPWPGSGGVDRPQKARRVFAGVQKQRSPQT